VTSGSPAVRRNSLHYWLIRPAPRSGDRTRPGRRRRRRLAQGWARGDGRSTGAA
jgi:hypothetical protein